MTGIFCLDCRTYHLRGARCSPRALKAAGGAIKSGEATGRRAVPSAPVPAKVGFIKKADAKPAPARPNRVPSGKSAHAPQTIKAKPAREAKAAPPIPTVTTPHEALRKLEEIRAHGAARAKKFRDKKKDAKNVNA